MNFVQGLQYYYRKDKWHGIVFFIKARFYQHITKKLVFANWHYFLDPYRVITKRYEESIRLIDDSFITLGNYAISKAVPINEESVIYSLGVLNETSFDEAISRKYGCNVHLFDPSIIATRHIKKLNNPRFVFQQIGIWNEETEFTFSTPVYGGSPSMVFEHPGRKFVAKCETLPTVMQSLSHEKIDILKLDVEGAERVILSHALDNNIHPTQVVVEFERKKGTKSVTELLRFFNEVDCLRARFKSLGYSEWRLPRSANSFYSIEMVFVRFDKDDI